MHAMSWDAIHKSRREGGLEIRRSRPVSRLEPWKIVRIYSQRTFIGKMDPLSIISRMILDGPYLRAKNTHGQSMICSCIRLR